MENVSHNTSFDEEDANPSEEQPHQTYYDEDSQQSSPQNTYNDREGHFPEEQFPSFSQQDQHTELGRVYEDAHILEYP